MRLLFVIFAIVGAGDIQRASPQKRRFASILLASNPAFARNPGRSVAIAGKARAEEPNMILDQLTKAADDLKGAAAETIIAKKVQDKLEKAKEKYNIPEKYEAVMVDLFTSYMTEVYKAGKDMDHYEGLLTQLFKRVLEQFKNPYKFEPFHEAIREPFDYYALGTDFVAGVVNSEDSVVLGQENIAEIQEHLKNGENVVMLANHQSEADPQIYSVLMDPLHPGFAESTIFVAGDRVTTDLFAQPFSMGRNLLCIFSKKHIENPPEQKAEKSKHNKQVMIAMRKLFGEGGKLIWVAPSGGRDRKNPETGKYQVAPFDSASVAMFKLIGTKATKKTHFYPLSMLTSTISAAPDKVGGDIGEFRDANYAPAALYFGAEIDLEKFAEGEKEAMREALSQHVHDEVEKNYNALEAALKI